MELCSFQSTPRHGFPNKSITSIEYDLLLVLGLLSLGIVLFANHPLICGKYVCRLLNVLDFDRL